MGLARRLEDRPGAQKRRHARQDRSQSGVSWPVPQWQTSALGVRERRKRPDGRQGAAPFRRDGDFM